MMGIRLSVPLLSAALAAACVPVTVVPPGGGGTGQPDACGASRWQGYVGLPFAALQAGGVPADVRILRPGTAMTMDYSETRLNVALDSLDRVERVYCG
jgi:hypothetical protein